MRLEFLEEGILRYGTPLYIFDTDEAKRTAEQMKKRLEGKAGLCYAMKANPFLTNIMASVTDRIEVCSMGEFCICRDQGIDPEKILISGVLKKRKDILEILDTYRGKCRYTIESYSQYHCFSEWCSENHERLDVYLRLTSGNQFGLDEDAVRDIIKAGSSCPWLKIRGIHYFSGTQKKSAEKIQKELEYLDQFCQSLEEEEAFQVEELEYGPGLFVPYFDGQKDSRWEDAKTLADALGAMNWKGRAMIELGRALAASCGYYLTRVEDVKQNNGKNYCIVDGGLHHLNYDGQIRGMYCPSMRVSPTREGEEEKEWTVCGALCTGNDILVQKFAAAGLLAGDVLIFERAGAYAMTEGMALFLSHPLPKVALYSQKAGYKLIRKDLKTYQWNMEQEENNGNFDGNLK